MKESLIKIVLGAVGIAMMLLSFIMIGDAVKGVEILISTINPYLVDTSLIEKRKGLLGLVGIALLLCAVFLKAEKKYTKVS